MTILNKTQTMLLVTLCLTDCTQAEAPADAVSDTNEAAAHAQEIVSEPTVTELEEIEIVVSTQETVSASLVYNSLRRQRTEAEELVRVPQDAEELRQRSIQTLLRVCISEEGWANPGGCRAIWQTAQRTHRCLTEDNIAVSCRSEEAAHPHRRAPTLAGLWHLSPRASGVRVANRSRQQWTAGIQTTCEEPENWPQRTRSGQPYALWRNYRAHCERLVQDITRIVDGVSEQRACPPRSQPIAWGCDPERRAAITEVLGLPRPARGCNDSPIAHRRGLHRLNCGETENAFWCRPGTPHCNTLPRSERVYRQNRASLPEQTTHDAALPASTEDP